MVDRKVILTALFLTHMYQLHSIIMKHRTNISLGTAGHLV